MNLFRTELKLGPAPQAGGLKTRFLTFGSCFSEAIGHRLQQMKFETAVNPFGVIYNPVSIHRVILYALDGNVPPASTFLRQQDIHLNYDFHSRFSSLDQEQLTNRITTAIGDVRADLAKADVVMLTYGTTWVYQLKDNAHVVANCHKKPSTTFDKRLLSLSEIHTSFGELYGKLTKLNANIRIILTVSPVRHVRDTLPLNCVSKSLLRVACHQISEEFNGVEYFPAYEIMMDDLRDYRFYKDDMIHPSELAENYIWERFVERYLDERARQFMEKWTKILAALNHKPFHTNSSGHKNFLKDVLNKLQDVQDIVNVDAEMNRIQAQLDPSYHKKL